MTAGSAGTDGPPAFIGEPVTHAEAVNLAERYVGAYNARDLEAMLAVMDESVRSYPAPFFGHRPHSGHAGVRAWWAAMVASRLWFDVVVDDVRQVGADRVAILGEIRHEGRRRSPWAVFVRVRHGLIVESRSYLSEQAELERLGLLA